MQAQTTLGTALLIVATLGCATAQKPRSTTMHTAQNPSQSALNTFSRLLLAIDARQWREVRTEMADMVFTDYQNLFGAPPAEAPADTIVAQWTALLGPLDATQHVLGAPAVEVAGDEASIVVSVRGYHYAHGLPDGDEWLVAGQYHARLRRIDNAWKLTHLRLDTHAQSGNRGLLAQAGERARNLPAGDGFRVEPVRFTSRGERLAGHLYWPAEVTGPVPRVVVLGSWTTVKEQMAGLYAQRLARLGFAALAFDPTGNGESAGPVRDLESPAAKIADVRAAAAYLAAHPNVDGTGGVNALGICAGAGYVAGAAAEGPAIAKVALVAPWLHDAALVQAIYGGREGVDARMRAAQAARARFQQEGIVEYVPAASAEDASAAMFGPFQYYLSPERGAVEAWPNRFAVMAWAEWLEFDPHPFAAKLSQPTLIVHSEDAAIPDGAKRFYQAIEAPKQVHWMNGDQFDFYDQAATVDQAVAQVVLHFGR